MRVIFMGTPEFAVPSLEALNEKFEVVAVVTRPDAVRGRGKTLEPSPVKLAAQNANLNIIETNKMSPEVIEQLRALNPDAIAVAAFGCILPDEVIDMAPLGCVNVHASLLPRWRGAAPIQRAVLEGDKHVGISIMKVVSELDAGDYCARASVTVGNKNATQLMAELGKLGAGLLPSSLLAIESGDIKWVAQDESEVTYARKISKAEMRLDPEDDGYLNKRRIQASTDAQPAKCVIAGKGVRVLRAAVIGEGLERGAVAVGDGRVFLGCGDNALELLDVKPDGKREMKVSEWAQGLRGDELTWERA